MRIQKYWFVALFLAFSAQNALADKSSISINQSLEYAFTYSPNLQSLQENRQQAEHQVRQAEAGYYPTIGIWAGAGVIQESTPERRFNNEDSDSLGSTNMGLMLSQSIWQGGATSSMVRSREAGLEASMFDVLDNATALAYNTISVHTDVIRRRYLVQLAINNVKEHEKILRLLKSRFAQGLSSRGDLEQVKSRLSRAEATLEAHQEGLDAALANYLRITGKYPQKKLLPVPNPAQMFEEPEEVRDLCVKYNYALKAKMAQINSLIGERDYSRANFAPHFTLDAGPSYTNTDYGGDAHELTWSAMVNMKWNLYSGGADSANFKSQSARVRAARKDLHAIMDALDEQINIIYIRTMTARRQAILFAEASKASRIAKDNFFIQFEVGQKDLLNVLDAETEFFTAAVEATIKRTDALLGQYRMYALAGTLLSTVNIDSEAISKGKPVRADIDNVTPWSLTASPKEVDTISNLKDSTLLRE